MLNYGFLGLLKLKSTRCNLAAAWGNIEKSFPTTNESHARLKESFLQDLIGKKEFQITYFNDNQTIADDPIFIEAYTKQEAEKLFCEDYSNKKIYSVECV